MADVVDLAAGIEAEHVAYGLARINAAIPAGVAGECDECGEIMPRLIGGRCGFCRDGRTPPPSFYDRAPPTGPAPVPSVQARPKEPDMTDTPRTRAITFPARGEVLDQLESRAQAGGVSLSAVTLELVQRALLASEQGNIDALTIALAHDALDAIGDDGGSAIPLVERIKALGNRIAQDSAPAPEAAIAAPAVPIVDAIVDREADVAAMLASVPIARLIEAVQDRVANLASPADLFEATKRAAVAEERLVMIQQVLMGGEAA